jgi:dipeptidyl aminopeptidase/acylaminoacyl peptidase
MMYQGYIVVAPEYRGSTGYGEGFYKAIDYGGAEVEDCDAARKYMIETMILWMPGVLVLLDGVMADLLH